MTKEERYTLLERYLRSEMTDSEQRQFEKVLAKQPDLQKELQLHRELAESVDPKRLAFLETLVEVEAHYFQESPAWHQRPAVRRIMLMAATILFLIVGVWLFKPASPEISPLALFEQYYSPYESPGNFRSEELLQLDEDLILGLAHYDEGDYTSALTDFSKVISRDDTHRLARFLRGLSYLGADRPIDATTDLQWLVGQEDNLFAASSRWYLALCYLKIGNLDQAQFLLSQLPDHQKAPLLLQDLEQ